MVDIQVGQALKVTLATNNGPSIFYGQYLGSDDSTYILRSGTYASREHWVFINREKITAIEKISTLAKAQ